MPSGRSTSPTRIFASISSTARTRRGSEALAARFGKGQGAGTERVDLDGATLSRDPARLSDEASSISMFGDKRWIRVAPVGDEATVAVEAFLANDVGGDTVVLVAGNLRKNAKLLALCEGRPDVLCIISYALDARSGEQVALGMARERGLILSSDLARRLVALSSGERGLLLSEIDKLGFLCRCDTRGAKGGPCRCARRARGRGRRAAPLQGGRCRPLRKSARRRA